MKVVILAVIIIMPTSYEEITLKQLSNVAGYSSWHSARIFKEITGRAPFDYIRALRLTKAALVLRDEEHRIIDVALDFVFDSHEGFTRAFSREFGLPPKRYSQSTPPIQLFMPERVFEVDCDVWSLLSSVKEAMYEPIGMWLPDHLVAKGTSQYVQGVELPLDYSNNVPEGYDCVELPPCKMMVFQGELYNGDNFMDEIGEIWDHIEKFNPNVYGYNWAPEAAPRFQLAPMGYRGYIEARPVVTVN